MPASTEGLRAGEDYKLYVLAWKSFVAPSPLIFLSTTHITLNSTSCITMVCACPLGLITVALYEGIFVWEARSTTVATDLGCHFTSTDKRGKKALILVFNCLYCSFFFICFCSQFCSISVYTNEIHSTKAVQDSVLKLQELWAEELQSPLCIVGCCVQTRVMRANFAPSKG